MAESEKLIQPLRLEAIQDPQSIQDEIDDPFSDLDEDLDCHCTTCCTV